MFYLANVKIVPENIYQLLTPRGLAFWIMDDGSKHGTGLHISVYAFSNTDVDKLMFTLQDKFALTCSIHYNRDKNLKFTFLKNLWTN
uniref:Cytb protein n=1 Tax=Venturia inaequalis TaxID=5025 RepID=O47504_VENIN|nr:group I intron orf [Venturia inaequalis]